MLLADSALALPPDQISIELEARLRDLTRAAADHESAGTPASALIASAGLVELVASRATDPDYGPALGPVLAGGALRSHLARPVNIEEVPGETKIGEVNLRLALTSMTQTHGFEDNFAILDSQPDGNQKALAVQSGKAGLADLAGFLGLVEMGGKFQGKSLELGVPLVIMPGATLRLAPGEELLLRRTTGAFIVNFGTLLVEGAAIATVGDPAPNLRKFRPFLATADGGSLILRGATITGLGFGDTAKFAGVSVLASLSMPSNQPVIIENSTFADIRGMVIDGEAAPLISGNRFHDIRGSALILRQVTAATITGNLFYGELPTNAIRVEQGSVGAVIADNVILGGEWAGIVIRNKSHGAHVIGNVVFDRRGGGIAIKDSDCALVEGNLVISNGQKGIDLRDTVGSLVRANSVLSNHSAALWISDQKPETRTRIEGNIVAFNGAGLAGAQGGTLVMQGNDLTHQYLQFVGGDLVGQSSVMASRLRDSGEIILVSGDPVDPAAEASSAPVCQP